MRIPSFKILVLCGGLAFWGNCSPLSPAEPDVPESDAEETERASEDDHLPVSFVAFGDWGTGTQEQFDVAAALEAKCEVSDCDMALLLGDNFYDAGVQGVDDPLFHDYFEVPYRNLDMPFYPVLGNHDAAGDTQAQIDYSALNPKWIMPGYYYTHAHGNGMIEFFALDSNDFDEAQQQWLARRLEASDAVWKILYNHHPLISNGAHGDHGDEEEAAFFNSICGSFDLIVSGHDHNMEHLQEDRDGCELRQIVLGSGGRSLRAVSPDARSHFARSVHGFGWFLADFSGLMMQFLSSDGTVEYQYLFTKE